MDSFTYPTSHDRAIKSATRNTGAFTTTRGFEDGVTTFSAKNREGKVVVSGKVAGEGEVTFSTSPNAARKARDEKHAARKAEKAAADSTE